MSPTNREIAADAKRLAAHHYAEQQREAAARFLDAAAKAQRGERPDVGIIPIFSLDWLRDFLQTWDGGK